MPRIDPKHWDDDKDQRKRDKRRNKRKRQQENKAPETALSPLPAIAKGVVTTLAGENAKAIVPKLIPSLTA